MRGQPIGQASVSACYVGCVELIRGCDECLRLFGDYAKCTHKLFRLRGKLQIAAIARERKTLEQLALEIQIAKEERAAAQNALTLHNAQPHPDQPDRSTRPL